MGTRRRTHLVENAGYYNLNTGSRGKVERGMSVGLWTEHGTYSNRVRRRDAPSAYSLMVGLLQRSDTGVAPKEGLCGLGNEFMRGRPKGKT
jgi:hypothetical protein